MRCGQCGNDNANSNRFCGMCGAALVVKTQAAGQLPAQVSSAPPSGSIAVPKQAAVPVAAGAAQSSPRPAPQLTVPAALGSTTAERREAPFSPSNAASRTEPIISGPSFLGLSTPGPASDRPAMHDPLPSSSRNLDYLLDDEEEPKRGGGKLILLVVALALALGFGYLRWKQGGFDWLNASNKKPAPATTSDAAQNADSGGSPTPASPDGAAPQAAANGGAVPPPGAAAPNPPDPAAGQATPQSAPPQATTSSDPASGQNSVPQSKPGDSNAATDTASQPASSDSEPSAPAETTAPPKAKGRTLAPGKPTPAKPTAARPFDTVAEAERYIYGRGARQDCDHGMRLLKTAAQQSNPKAMISMGALYSTGTCTPRDLPTAYRWFALALHKQPDNQALQDDLKSLWDKMTQPERQLAIKLSQ